MLTTRNSSGDSAAPSHQLHSSTYRAAVRLRILELGKSIIVITDEALRIGSNARYSVRKVAPPLMSASRRRTSRSVVSSTPAKDPYRVDGAPDTSLSRAHPSPSNLDAYIRSKPTAGTFEDLMSRYKKGAYTPQGREDHFHCAAPLYDLSNECTTSSACDSVRQSTVGPSLPTLIGPHGLTAPTAQHTISRHGIDVLLRQVSVGAAPPAPAVVSTNTGYYYLLYIHQCGDTKISPSSDHYRVQKERQTCYVRALYATAPSAGLLGQRTGPIVVTLNFSRRPQARLGYSISGTREGGWKCRGQSQEELSPSPSPSREEVHSPPLQPRVERLHSWCQDHHTAVAHHIHQRRRTYPLDTAELDGTADFQNTQVATTVGGQKMFSGVSLDDHQPRLKRASPPTRSPSTRNLLLTPSSQRGNLDSDHIAISSQLNSDGRESMPSQPAKDREKPLIVNLEVARAGEYNPPESALAGAAIRYEDSPSGHHYPCHEQVLPADQTKREVVAAPITVRVGHQECVRKDDAHLT